MFTREQCFSVAPHFDLAFVIAYLCKQSYGKDLPPASLKAVAEAICATNKVLLETFVAEIQPEDGRGVDLEMLHNDWDTKSVIPSSENEEDTRLRCCAFIEYYFERGWSATVDFNPWGKDPPPRTISCWVEAARNDPKGIWYYTWRAKNDASDAPLIGEYTSVREPRQVEGDTDRILVGELIRIR